MKATYRSPAANVRGDVVSVTLGSKTQSNQEVGSFKLSGGASLSFGL